MSVWLKRIFYNPVQGFKRPWKWRVGLLKDQVGTIEGPWRTPQLWVKEARSETQSIWIPGSGLFVLTDVACRAHKLRQVIFGHAIFANSFVPCLILLDFNQELSCEVV